MVEGPLRTRTRAFSIAILKFLDSLPRTPAGRIVLWQLGRCGTSVGANYRRACFAQSANDFISKLKTVEEEIDESEFWLDLVVELSLGERLEATRLRNESRELRAMTTASLKTA
jgi:four helix bundle protein